MAGLTHAALLALLSTRWDALSAKGVLEITLDEAGVKEGPAYSADEAARFADRLARRKDRVQPVVELIRAANGGLVAPPEPAKPPAPPPPVEPAKPPEPPQEVEPVAAAPIEQAPAAEAKAEEAAPVAKKAGKKSRGAATPTS